VGVVLVKLYAVVFAQYYAYVAHLCSRDLAELHAEAVYGGVVADAFEREREFGIFFLAFYVKSLSEARLVHVVCRHRADETYDERSFHASGVETLAISLYDAVEPGVCLGGCLRIWQCDAYGLGVGGGDVDDHGVVFKRAVVLVCPDALIQPAVVASEVCVACAVVRLHLKISGNGRLAVCLRPVYHGHNLETVCSRPQSGGIGTPVRAVVAYQLVVEPCPCAVVRPVYIDVVGRGTGQKFPLCPCCFEPACRRLYSYSCP